MRLARHVLYGLACSALLMLGRVPAATAQEADPSSQEGTTRVYVVKEGDTLFRIAQRHNLSVARLRELNGLENTTIYPGQELRVASPAEARSTRGGEAPPPASDSAASDTPSPPTPPGGAPASPVTEEPAVNERAAHDSSLAEATGAPLYGAHTVEDGATFYTIAARYGTSVDTLRALNRSAGSFLRPGATLRLPPSLGPPTHTVAEGETIYDLARQYSVSARQIQRVNDLESKEVRPGQRLRIPGRSAPEPQPKGTRPPVRFSGPVARYPASYEGRLMAGGTRYRPERYVASHPSLPIGTVVLLTNPVTGRHTFATVADRGPLDEQYVMDVSAAVYERLGLAEGSMQPIEVRVMD